MSDFIRLEWDELRGDRDEGLAQSFAADGAQLSVERDGEWVLLGTISGSLRSPDPAAQQANVFCMYAFRGSQAEIPIDPRNLRFGDTFVVFTNGDEFLRRARAEAERRGLELKSGLVEYVDSVTYKGRMGIFRKFSAFAFQSECRLALLPGTGEPYSLRLGSLSDIALISDLSDVNRRIQITEEAAAQPTHCSKPRLAVLAAAADCGR